MRMSKFFFQLVIVIHVFACAWYCLACPLNECYQEENWVKHQGNSCHQLQDKLDSSTWILLNFSFILKKVSKVSYFPFAIVLRAADLPQFWTEWRLRIYLTPFYQVFSLNTNGTDSSVCRIPNEHHNCFNRSYASDLLHWFCCFLIAGLLDAPALTRYCTAVYWVVATMTSTGYGDIHGDNSYEMGEKSE